MAFLPGPIRLLANQPSLLLDLSPDGPLRYISRQKFTGFPEDPPESCLKGVKVLITGATSGVGLEAARKFLQLGADIVMTARNMQWARQVKARLQSEVEDGAAGSRVALYELSMDTLDSVDQFVDQLEHDKVRLNIAVLNAGGLSWENPAVDGGWLHNMQVNFRSTAYLGLRLVPVMSPYQRHAGTGGASPGSRNEISPRLVFVSSEGHAWSTYRPPRDGPVLTPMQPEEMQTAPSPEQDYYTAKMFLALFGRELAQAKSPRAVDVVVTSPGFCSSGFFKDGEKLLTRAILYLHARSAEHGAKLHVHAATCLEADVSGKYLRDGHPASLSTFAESQEGHELGVRLWSEMAGLVSSRRPKEARIILGK